MLAILMVGAAASLAMGIKTEGITKGWYDGGRIVQAVIIVTGIVYRKRVYWIFLPFFSGLFFVSSASLLTFSDYKQSLQFQTIYEEMQNIHLEVTRGGRRVDISTFDILPLKISDQVPADCVLISGHSLAIDESSMTGKSNIVTNVGINTEWGLLMASISEDNGEETPLQVRLNGVATFIGIICLTVAVAVLVVLPARYFTAHSKDDEGKQEYFHGKTKVSDVVDGATKIFTVAVTIVVVAVPEVLPLAVTLMSKMASVGIKRDLRTLVYALVIIITLGVGTADLDSYHSNVSGQDDAICTYSTKMGGCTEGMCAAFCVPRYFKTLLEAYCTDKSTRCLCKFTC